MPEEIRRILEGKRAALAEEGFVITGFFGPYARGEESHESDIDILFSISDGFVDRHGGMGALARIEAVRLMLEEELCIQVSLTDRETLDPSMEKIIMPEVADV